MLTIRMAGLAGEGTEPRYDESIVSTERAAFGVLVLKEMLHNILCSIMTFSCEATM